MDADTIDRLACLTPDPKSLVSKNMSRVDQAVIGGQGVKRFLCGYVNVAVGWYFATEFARIGRFPLHMVGKDEWVFKAYLMRKDPKRFHNQHIADAFCLATIPEGQNMGDSIRGMIIAGCKGKLTPDEHLEGVARSLGTHVDTVKAFEVLFYNVLDRWRESLIIGKRIYPEGRGVEMQEGYFQNTPIADLIARAGYNYQDPNMVSYMAGIGDMNYMSTLAGRSDREDFLERMLMGNGLMLMHMGGSNARGPGLSRATAMLTASRQAGPKVEEPATSSIFALIKDQLNSNADKQRAQKLAIARRDAGVKVIDAETVPAQESR